MRSARAVRAVFRAAGSASRSSSGQPCQLPPPWACLIAMNRLYSGSQSALSARNLSQASATRGFIPARQAVYATSTSRRLFAVARPNAASPAGSSAVAASLAVISPSASRASGLMRFGFPANAEKHWYGESPYPVGPSGRVCHHACPAAARASTQATASGPRSPMPYRPGRLVGCSRTPDERAASGWPEAVVIGRPWGMTGGSSEVVRGEPVLGGVADTVNEDEFVSERCKRFGKPGVVRPTSASATECRDRPPHRPSGCDSADSDRSATPR